MGIFRQFPVFWSAIVGCALAGGLFAWQYRNVRAQAGRLQQELERERREWRALEAQAMLAAAAGRDREIALEQGRWTRRALLSALARGEAILQAGAPVPRSRTEACASLAAMAQGLRDLAAAHGIGVSPEEGFGFAEFAQAGPEMDHLAEVHRESRVVDAAVRLLIEAHPVEMLGVRRGKADAPAGGPTGANGLAGRTTVRLEFRGDTSVLRDLLNRLAQSEIPLRVRSVEAEPIPPAAVGPGSEAVGPLILPALMNYTVAMECIHLDPSAVGENPAGTMADAPASSPAVWLSPARANANVTHCDLFTAPRVDYDRAAGAFVVRRNGEEAAPPAPAAAVAEKVAKARREPYRVQLLGHVGAGAALAGTFADLSSGVTFLARAGQTVSQSAIAVRTLQRLRHATKAGEPKRMPEWVTVAEIDDLLTGETIMLTDESRKEIEVMR